ncbi:hypothetical protein VTK26DRAFT_8684 [Humicola hyalothermophila]
MGVEVTWTAHLRDNELDDVAKLCRELHEYLARLCRCCWMGSKQTTLPGKPCELCTDFHIPPRYPTRSQCATTDFALSLIIPLGLALLHLLFHVHYAATRLATLRAFLLSIPCLPPLGISRTAHALAWQLTHQALRPCGVAVLRPSRLAFFVGYSSCDRSSLRPVNVGALTILPCPRPIRGNTLRRRVSRRV